MTALEHSLLQSLLELEDTFGKLSPANPKPDLRALFARINELARQLPCGTDPTLLHYLHKRSYQKARLYLQGRDAENAMGACRHV